MFQKKYTKYVLVLFAAASIAGLAYRHHQRYKHLAVHEGGMMYRAAWVEPDVMSTLIERYQIRAVVNLCEPGEMGEQRWVDERAAVKNSGARLIELPMPTSVDITHPQIAKHLEILNNPDNYPMLVHCQHGVTRTAKFLSIYDIVHRGMTAEESLNAQPLFGRDQQNVHVSAFVRNFEKQYRSLYPIASASKLDVLKQ